LAAYGLSLSLLLLFESPLLSIVSAAVALLTDFESHHLLRRYTIYLGLMMSGLLGVLLLPGPYETVVLGWMGIEPGVATLLHRAALFMLPCPFVVGYRRLYQGVLVRAGRTPLVSLGTFIRILSLAVTCFVADRFFGLDGAVIGGLALGIGMSIEAVYARVAASGTLALLPTNSSPPGVRSAKAINKFYLPLALSTVIGLAAQPVLSAFVARSAMAIESLAVIPVVNGLTIFFRSAGFSYQEVVITFLTVNPANRRALRRFGARAAVAVGLIFAVISFTPLLFKLYTVAGGLSPDLALFATTPTRILTLVPVLGLWMFLMRGEVIFVHQTRLITVSCIAEVVMAVSIMVANHFWFNLPGAVAIGLAGLFGACAGTAALIQSHWINPVGHPDPAEVAQHTTPPPLELAAE
jgi:hypothetical protein